MKSSRRDFLKIFGAAAPGMYLLSDILEDDIPEIPEETTTGCCWNPMPDSSVFYDIREEDFTVDTVYDHVFEERSLRPIYRSTVYCKKTGNILRTSYHTLDGTPYAPKGEIKNV